MSTSETKLFISYSRTDRALVERLYDALTAEDELRVFRDTDDILPSEELKPRLEKLIREADTVLFAVSPRSVTSDVCSWELELADSLNKRIIPVVVENVEGDVPTVVSKLNYIFLTQEDDFDRNLERIQNAISLDIDWIREHTRLAELADRWEKSARLGAQPLRGKELEAAETWLVEQPKSAPSPTQAQRQYILVSRQAATKRQRMTVAGSLAAVLVVGVLGVFAWMQRNEAIKNEDLANDALERVASTANHLVRNIASDRNRPEAPTPVYESILSSALDLQEQTAELVEPTPELLLVRAQSLTNLASHQFNLGQLGNAKEMLREAIETVRGIEWPDQSRITSDLHLAKSYLRLARVEYASLDKEASSAWLGQAELSIQRLEETHDLQDWRQMKELALLNIELAEHYGKTFRKVRPVQLAAARKATVLGRSVVSIETTPDNMRILADGLYLMAYLLSGADSGEIVDGTNMDVVEPGPTEYSDQENHVASESALQEAVAIYGSLSATADGQVVPWRVLGEAHFLQGRLKLRVAEHKAALEHFETAERSFRTAHLSDPTNPKPASRLLQAQRFKALAMLRDAAPVQAVSVVAKTMAFVEQLPREITEDDDVKAILGYFQPMVQYGTAFTDLEQKEDSQSWADYSLYVESFIANQSQPSRQSPQDDNSPSEPSMTDILDKLLQADEAFHWKEYNKALVLQFEAVQMWIDDPERFAHMPDWLYTQLANLSYYALLEKEDKLAMQAAEIALTYVADGIVATGNLALAEMFSGDASRARSLFLSERGRKFDDGRTWEEGVLDDFVLLRDVGRSHPLMNEIEKTFSTD